MKKYNILPYDGHAVLIDDCVTDFDWPAITQALIDTMPWRIETARMFGREMPVPRMTAWFGDAAYTYSGICHRPAPFPAIVQRLRETAKALSGASYNAVLLNLYRHGGDSVGWHSDSEAGLGDCPTIASLSLGATRRFQFRHRRRSPVAADGSAQTIRE
jgi:alkylated DNA repair dioxygenase AlkB